MIEGSNLALMGTGGAGVIVGMLVGGGGGAATTPSAAPLPRLTAPTTPAEAPMLAAPTRPAMAGSTPMGGAGMMGGAPLGGAGNGAAVRFWGGDRSTATARAMRDAQVW